VHTIASLHSDMFSVLLDGTPSSIDGVLPDWTLWDRLGVVIDEPMGGIGASHMIQIAITSYYEASERRRGALEVYPDIYAIHVGKGWGTHSAFDFWPARREVILSDDPRDLLDAINDRGITRLVVPDRPEAALDYRPKEADTAIDRITSAFAYHPSGRADRADVTISGKDKRTEINPSRVIRPIRLEKTVKTAKAFKETDLAYIEWLKERDNDVTAEDVARVELQRKALLKDGAATETYRRIGVVEALKRMAWRAR
jgi:hypothetical protein